MCFMSHHYFPCTSHASLRGTGECVWCRLLGEGSPPLKKEERWTHKGIHPKPLPLTSQEVGTPNSSLLLWKLPLHPYSSLPASQGWLFPSCLCLYSAATCLLSQHGWGRSDRFLTIYGMRLEAGQTFIGSKCGGVQSTTTPHTHHHKDCFHQVGDISIVHEHIQTIHSNKEK